MTARPLLDRLADRLGVVPSFFDLQGNERRTSAATAEAIVAAMGHDASTEEAARRALVALAEAVEQHPLDPVQVWREHAAERPRVRLHAGPGTARGRLVLFLHESEGDSGDWGDGGDAQHKSVLEMPLSVAAGADGSASVLLPGRPPTGYHRVRVELDDGRVAEQRLVVAPRHAPLASELLAGRRAFGVSTNLYSVRRAGGLGFGDLTALDELVDLVARRGGDFVLVNPLHALRNRGDSISPYSPVSRLWHNVLYLDVERVAEEVLGREAGRRLTAAHELDAEQLRAADRIDYAAVADVAGRVLRAVHAAFRKRPAASKRAYTRFVAEGGDALRDHATFEALAEHFAEEPDWRRWPAGFRAADTPEVRAFRSAHEERVDFHRWIQFALDEQLAATARTARDSGLALGLMLDLAVGSPPDSGDAWAHAGLVARGVSLGAPPDGFAADGQDWGLAPLDPNRLRADGFRFWTRLLRASLRHAGGLRIDHAIGLERTFWIPDGRPGGEGAYVLQPADELLGVLALEAQRARALVIGEDLGVVPRGLKQHLASWGLLSTSVLLFERDGEGFLAPERYSPRALVAATTHDLVPLAGYVEGADLVLRGRLEGQDAAAVAGAQAERARDVDRLSRTLEAQDAADDAGSPAVPVAPDAAAVSAHRVHRYLARTPAPLLALALDDLGEEREPINLPGISTRRHPSWSRRMARPLSEIDIDPDSVPGRTRAIGTGS